MMALCSQKYISNKCCEEKNLVNLSWYKYVISIIILVGRFWLYKEIFVSPKSTLTTLNNTLGNSLRSLLAYKNGKMTCCVPQLNGNISFIHSDCFHLKIYT